MALCFNKNKNKNKKMLILFNFILFYFFPVPKQLKMKQVLYFSIYIRFKCVIARMEITRENCASLDKGSVFFSCFVSLSLIHVV